MSEILFYFDYISPYAYLAWRAIRMRRIEVRPMPVVFGALLEASGMLGPAEIPAKRKFLIRDCIRRADQLGVPFTFPPRHPFRTLDALRASIDRGPEVIDRLFAACWEHGRDISDPAVLRELIHPHPIPDDPAIKERLKKQTADAIARGVFGVPSYEVGGEIVWGSDRLEDAIAIAEERSRIDPARAEKLSAVPIGVVRGGPKPVDPEIA